MTLTCPEHKQDLYTRYCNTDGKLICEKCANTLPSKLPTNLGNEAKAQLAEGIESGHLGHNSKPLSQLLEKLLREKQDLRKQIAVEFEKLEAAIEYFSGVEQLFQKQRALQLQKLAVDFEVIRKLVDRKHVELKDKIEGIYDDSLRQAYRYIDGLSAMKQSI